MAKKGKIQVVDLGSHFVKAVQLEPGDGAPTISRYGAAAVPSVAADIETYLAGLPDVLAQLSDVIDNKSPVHFVASESLARLAVAYLNNLSAENVEDALAVERTKYINASGVTSYEQTVSKSYRLREKVQGPSLQVVVANVFVKADHIDALVAACTARKLVFGGIVPRLFGYRELFRILYGSDPSTASCVAVMVDAGFGTTGIVAFKDGAVVFHKVLFAGGKDFFAEMSTVSKLGLPAFATLMSQAGITDSAADITGTGLSVGDPAKILEAIQSQAEQVFNKIQLSIDYFSTVAATDFSTAMSTVMAVRKGPELVAFTGGLAAAPHFHEVAGQYFGKESVMLDPEAAIVMQGASQKTPLANGAFALAAGTASLLSTPEGAQYVLGEGASKRAESGGTSKGKTGASFSGGGGSTGGGGGGGGSGQAAVPTWATLIALVIFCGLGYMWFEADQQLKKLRAQVGAKESTLTDIDAKVLAFKKAREKEVRGRIVLEYAQALLKNRIPQSVMLKELVEHLPKDLKIFRMSVETTLPSAGAEDGPSQPKSVSFKLCGEALKLEGVNELVTNLQQTGHFVDIAPPDVVASGDGAGSVSGCTDPDQPSLEPVKHFAFQLTGKLAFGGTK